MIPFRTPFLLPLIYRDVTWRIPTERKEIYLTFDDGPIPEITEAVLEILSNHKATATFFCIGDNIRKNPSVYKKISEGHHAFGNHTFNHLKGWRTDNGTYLENIKLCEEYLNHDSQDTQRKRLFRPPYGQIRKSQIAELKREFEIIMWDVLTQDYSKTLSPDRCLKGTIAATRSGSIVVFHDSIKAQRNLLYALPRFLDHFSNLGYSFKAIK